MSAPLSFASFTCSWADTTSGKNINPFVFSGNPNSGILSSVSPIIAIFIFPICFGCWGTPSKKLPKRAPKVEWTCPQNETVVEEK